MWNLTINTEIQIDWLELKLYKNVELSKCYRFARYRSVVLRFKEDWRIMRTTNHWNLDTQSRGICGCGSESGCPSPVGSESGRSGIPRTQCFSSDGAITKYYGGIIYYCLRKWNFRAKDVSRFLKSAKVPMETYPQHPYAFGIVGPVIWILINPLYGLSTSWKH